MVVDEGDKNVDGVRLMYAVEWGGEGEGARDFGVMGVFVVIDQKLMSRDETLLQYE